MLGLCISWSGTLSFHWPLGPVGILVGNLSMVQPALLNMTLLAWAGLCM